MYALVFSFTGRGCIPLSTAKVHKKDEFCDKQRKEKNKNFSPFLRNIESLPLIRNAKIHPILPDRKHKENRKKKSVPAGKRNFRHTGNSANNMYGNQIALLVVQITNNVTPYSIISYAV